MAEIYKKQSNNCLMSIFTTRGVLTPKLWTPLNTVHRDTSFGTLHSLIKHMVPEIMSEISKKLSNNCFNVNFHHQRGCWPQSYGHHWIWLVETLLLAPCKVQSDHSLFVVGEVGQFVTEEEEERNGTQNTILRLDINYCVLCYKTVLLNI